MPILEWGNLQKEKLSKSYTKLNQEEYEVEGAKAALLESAAAAFGSLSLRANTPQDIGVLTSSHPARLVGLQARGEPGCADRHGPRDVCKGFSWNCVYKTSIDLD